MDGANTTTGGGSSGGAGEIMLFGFRVVVDSMRKSVSLNNLSQYVQPQDLAKTKVKENGSKDDVSCVVASATAAACGGGGDGYVSADDAVPHSSSNRTERKRGVPWTEEEHKLFLLGLQKVGKGDWRGISRNFVKTRTPTQVASHAQKYFLRRTNLNRRRRRTSLFDITTDSVTAVSMDDDQNHNQGNKINHPPESQPLRLPPSPDNSSTTSFTFMPSFSIGSAPVVLPVPVENPMENLSLARKASQGFNLSTNLTHPISVNPAPQPSATCNLNLDLNSSADPSLLSLRLPLPSEQNERHSSAFHVMSSFGNNDGIITVA